MGPSLSWAVFLGAFVGSLIELVEVLAVVLVVGRVAGWRNAIVGAGSAVGLVAVAALVVGKGLALIPARPLELVAGLILLGFGQAWARSVTKYYGGVLAAPAEEDDDGLQQQLARGGARGGWDPVALATAFKSSLLESFEIAIVVIGLGTAGGRWSEAITGALVAALVLIVFAFWLRAPLQRVPVKPAKFAAAALLMGFGTYWVGEGLGFGWPGGMVSLTWLPLLWGLLMAGGAAFLRWKRSEATLGPQTREGHKPPGGGT
jgi:Ca2+/H+ antiporter, TMEM165/GDT1 family